MSRSRTAILSSMGIVAATVAVSVGALVLSQPPARLGSLPPKALAILADARFAMGLNVSRFVASSFHQRFAHDPSTRPDALRELEAKTGLNPERDVDQIYAAGGAPGDNRGVAWIQGRFDRKRIAQAIETDQKGVTSKKHLGNTVYVFSAESKSPGALAFLDDQTILLGTEQAVEAVITRSLQGTPPQSSALTDLLGRVKPGSTFWIVGDQTVLSSLPRTVPGQGATAVTLPALKSLVVTGELEPEVSLSIVGDAADPAAAKSVADVVRGLVGILSLQASQKPEFARLVSAITVATEANEVHVDARIPYEVIDALSAKPNAPRAPEPPARP